MRTYNKPQIRVARHDGTQPDSTSTRAPRLQGHAPGLRVQKGNMLFHYIENYRPMFSELTHIIHSAQMAAGIVIIGLDTERSLNQEQRDKTLPVDIVQISHGTCCYIFPAELVRTEAAFFGMFLCHAKIICATVGGNDMDSVLALMAMGGVVPKTRPNFIDIQASLSEATGEVMSLASIISSFMKSEEVQLMVGEPTEKVLVGWKVDAAGRKRGVLAHQNWHTRPLRREDVAYAGLDVAFLPMLARMFVNTTVHPGKQIYVQNRIASIEKEMESRGPMAALAQSSAEPASRPAPLAQPPAKMKHENQLHDTFVWLVENVFRPARSRQAMINQIVSSCSDMVKNVSREDRMEMAAAHVDELIKNNIFVKNGTGTYVLPEGGADVRVLNKIRN